MRFIISEKKRDTRLTVADEAHAYKNIGINSQLQRFGLGVAFGFNGDNLASARSYDFRFKSNYISDRNNDGNVFLLTATPTPNKPMEIYTMLRHLSRNVFADYGIENDRDFSSTFFQLGNVKDPATGRIKSILKALVNAVDLRGILNRFVDKIRMEDMPWIKIPGANEQQHVLEQSAEMSLVTEDLVARQKSLPQQPTEGDDTKIAIYTGGRNASIDPRLYGGEHAGVSVDVRSGNRKDDKLQWTIESVAKVWKSNPKAGQLIFLDNAGFTQVEKGVLLKDLHTEIKDELVGMGFKPGEVAIINGAVTTNPSTGKEIKATGDKRNQLKQDVADAYNAGKVKVVIGSTVSMGEGMDLQVKTTDIYHMDIPYTPGAIRQRNGRGLRYGNENPEVNIHYLLMQGTFDSRSLALVQTKKGWNEAIWDKNVADTISTEEEMSEGGVSDTRRMFLMLEKDPAIRRHIELEFDREDKQQAVWGLKEDVFRTRKGLDKARNSVKEAEQTLAEREAKLASAEDIADGEIARQYHALGVDLAGWIGQDRRAAKNLVDRVGAVSAKDKVFVTAKSPIDGLRGLFGVTEAGPRIAEFSAALDYAKGKGMGDLDAAVLAAVAAKDVTVNFSRAGEYARFLNMTNLFFNAQVQSMDKLGRTFWKHPARTIRRGATAMTIPCLLAYALNKGTDWWDELPPWEKWNYAHLEIPGTGIVLRIPLPFEFGGIFGALPIAALEGEESFKEALGVVLDNATPDVAPSALKPILDIFRNEDFTGRPVVPANVQGRLPEDQYGPRTGEIAKLAGRVLGQSPAQIEHLVNSYTGGLYKRVAGMLESVADPSTITGEPADWPVVGTLFLRKDISRVAGDFYTRLSELGRKHASHKSTLEEAGEYSMRMGLQSKLRDEWAKIRDIETSDASGGEKKAQARDIRRGIDEQIREFEKTPEAEFRQRAIGMAAYQLSREEPTDPDRHLSSLKDVDLEEIVEALRQEYRRRGWNTKMYHQNQTLTSFGKAYHQITNRRQK